MLETKEQKTTIITVLVLILILGLVTFFNKPKFNYQDTTDYTLSDSTRLDAEKYLQYLNSLQVDPKASKELFEKLITQQELQKMVEEDLGVNQPLEVPKVEDRDITLDAGEGQAAVLDYLAQTTSLVLNFNTQNRQAASGLLTGQIEEDKKLLAAQEKLVADLKSVKTPKEAVLMQKSLLISNLAFGDLIKASINQDISQDQENKPWPEVYKNYAIINDQVAFFGKSLEAVSEKYKITQVQVKLNIAQNQTLPTGGIIKPAYALFGFGDITITIGDIPRIIKEAIEEGLTTSFAQFMGSFIEKMISKIESNYLIANFLYYSDALVAGQYAEDYLQKYVQDNLDRQIIKKFIPQFSCGQQPSNLQPIFKAKAAQSLGFDPTKIDPNDPNYFEKMRQVGNFLSSPTGWETNYSLIADQAKAEAEKAAEKEMLSPGLKTPRDTVNRAIGISINNIVSAEKAGLNALMILGQSTAKNFISKFISQLTQNLMNNFVFRGAAASSGSLGVLKEQSACLAAAQMQLVLPTTAVQYQQPPTAPTAEQILEQECAKFARGCSVINSPAFDAGNP